MKEKRNMNNELTNTKAFKHTPSVEISTWYKGILITRLATAKDTGGAFDLILPIVRKGDEPPPHVHAQEQELFYVLEGNVDVYVGAEVFHLAAGECAFLPQGIPHAYLIQSPELRMLALITPGGFMDAFRPMEEPAKKMEIPSDMVTYATDNLEETMKILEQYGLRFLSPNEIAREMPAYPTPFAIPI